MSQDSFFILTPPAQLPRLREYPCLPVHPVYRISPFLRLTRIQGHPHLRGGIMAVGDSPTPPRGSPGAFCMELLRECAFRGCRGILLDLEQPNHPLAPHLPQLESLLSRQGVRLFIPEEYADRLSSARVLISSALSGGSLSHRLSDAVARFGRDRVVLAVEKSAEDFILPALSGCGTPIPPEQLSRLTASSSFFSPQLCANYRLCRDADEQIHFLLWDDASSICQKLEQARAAGINRFLLPWADISACPEQFGLSQFTSKKS